MPESDQLTDSLMCATISDLPSNTIKCSFVNKVNPRMINILSDFQKNNVYYRTYKCTSNLIFWLKSAIEQISTHYIDTLCKGSRNFFF